MSRIRSLLIHSTTFCRRRTIKATCSRPHLFSTAKADRHKRLVYQREGFLKSGGSGGAGIVVVHLYKKSIERFGANRAVKTRLMNERKPNASAIWALRRPCEGLPEVAIRSQKFEDYLFRSPKSSLCLFEKHESNRKKRKGTQKTPTKTLKNLRISKIYRGF